MTFLKMTTEGLISNQINDSYAELKGEIENESDRKINLTRQAEKRVFMML